MGWWRRYLKWRRRNVVWLALRDDGFSLVRVNNTIDVKWSPIDQVTAYKRDLYTTDLFCLLIEEGAAIVEIDEDMEGYLSVEQALAAVLGLGPEWKATTLFPPFEPNVTPIFDRHRVAA